MNKKGMLNPQHKTILTHLRKLPHLSTVEAILVHRIGRVATRVHELKQMGYNIQTEMAKDVTGKRYARYKLIENLPVPAQQ